MTYTPACKQSETLSTTLSVHEGCATLVLDLPVPALTSHRKYNTYFDHISKPLRLAPSALTSKRDVCSSDPCMSIIKKCTTNDTYLVFSDCMNRLFCHAPRMLHLPKLKSERVAEDRAGMFQLCPWVAASQRWHLQNLRCVRLGMLMHQSSCLRHESVNYVVSHHLCHSFVAYITSHCADPW